MLKLVMQSDKNSSRRRIVPRSGGNAATRRAIRRVGLRVPIIKKPSALQSTFRMIGDIFSWRGWPTLLSLVGLLAVWISFKSLDLNQNANDDARYKAAVSQVASDKYLERIAGLQALHKIKLTTPERATEIDDLISSFIDVRRSEITSCNEPWRDVAFAFLHDLTQKMDTHCSVYANGAVMGIVYYSNVASVVPLNAKAFSSQEWIWDHNDGESDWILQVDSMDIRGWTTNAD